MDALQLLKADHDKVRGLFEQFQSVKDSGDPQRLAALQRDIFTELEVHTAIEEEVFYPEAEAVGGEAEELVKEGEQEHHVVKVLMDEIAALQPDHEEFVPKMTVLIENVEHHAEEEEEELFPKLRETFGDERLQRMGGQLEQAKQRHLAAGAGGRSSGDAAEPTRDELYEAAKEQDLPGRSSMTKAELAEALEQDG